MAYNLVDLTCCSCQRPSKRYEMLFLFSNMFFVLYNIILKFEFVPFYNNNNNSDTKFSYLSELEVHL